MAINLLQDKGTPPRGRATDKDVWRLLIKTGQGTGAGRYGRPISDGARGRRPAPRLAAGMDGADLSE